MLKKYEEEIIKLLDQLQVIGGLTVILLGVVPRAGMTAAGTAAYRALSQRYSAITKNDSNAWYLHVEAVLRTKTQPAGTQEGMDTNPGGLRMVGGRPDSGPTGAIARTDNDVRRVNILHEFHLTYHASKLRAVFYECTDYSGCPLLNEVAQRMKHIK